ncbi:NUDIX domain-containing protein [Candidatus Nomurabacteria bacterium]|nr:NUDIX domain-containing protein [Candidatus Nomurabacteria bacterium]
MKLNFKWKDDGTYHQYCIGCNAEEVERIYKEDKTYYFCSYCKKQYERSIVIDPGIKWWIDNDLEYWHESAGVFIRNPDDKFLFFERNIFPFALTVPSGHLDTNENPLDSAKRETEEEVGIKPKNLTSITTENIVGDSCRRGADIHRWHAFLLELKTTLDIQVRDEGSNPVWLTLDQAAQRNLIYPVKYIISKYGNELIIRNISG